MPALCNAARRLFGVRAAGTSQLQHGNYLSSLLSLKEATAWCDMPAGRLPASAALPELVRNLGAPAACVAPLGNRAGTWHCPADRCRRGSRSVNSCHVGGGGRGGGGGPDPAGLESTLTAPGPRHNYSPVQLTTSVNQSVCVSGAGGNGRGGWCGNISCAISLHRMFALMIGIFVIWHIKFGQEIHGKYEKTFLEHYQK